MLSEFGGGRISWKTKGLRFELDLEDELGEPARLSRLSKSENLHYFFLLSYLFRFCWPPVDEGSKVKESRMPDFGLGLFPCLSPLADLCKGLCKGGGNMRASCYGLAWYCGLLLSSKTGCVSHAVKVLSIKF